MAVRGFRSLETEHRHVDGPVAQVNPLGERRIGAPDFDHVKNLLVKLRCLLGVRRMQRYMSQLGHGDLLSSFEHSLNRLIELQTNLLYHYCILRMSVNAGYPAG